MILGILWLAYVTMFFTRFSIPPLAPFLRDDLHLTASQIGLLMSASGIGYTVLQIPAGWLADLVGVRRVLVAGLMMAGFFILGMHFVTSFNMSLIVLLLAGFGCGFLFTATTKAIICWFPMDERALAMGVKQTAVNIGGILGAIILPSLALAYGWRYGFTAVGGLAITAAVATMAFYREPPGTFNPNSTYSLLTKKAIRQVLFDRNILLLSFSTLFFIAAEYSAITYLVVYLKDALFVPVVLAGRYLALANAAGALGKPVFGMISDRLLHGGRRIPLIFLIAAAGVICVGIGLLLPGIHLLALTVIIILFGLVATGSDGISVALTGEFAGRELTGIALGFSATISLVGSIVGPPLFGYIVDVSGSYRTAWGLQGVWMAIALVLVYLLREEERRT